MQKSVNKKKASKFSVGTIVMTAIFILLFLYCFSLLLPVFWMIWTSFKDVVEFYLYPFDLPQAWYFTNYIEVLDMLKVSGIRGGEAYSYGVFGMTGYSLLISATLPIKEIIWTVVSGYILSKYEFRGKKVFMAINLFVMTVPFVGTLPAQIAISKALGRYDNLLMMSILGGTPFGFAFLLYYGAFKGISKTYSEAAFLDGASHFTVMFRVIVPMVFPTIVARYLLSFIAHWNDYMTIVTWLPSYPNLAYGMYMFQAEASRYGAGMPHILAGFVVVAIPTSALWIMGQKLITSKMMVGGLKE